MKIPGTPAPTVPKLDIDPNFIEIAQLTVMGQNPDSIYNQLVSPKGFYKPDVKGIRHHTVPELTPEQNDQFNGTLGTRRTT